MGINLNKTVDKFLGWKLPESFSPDCYVSFDAEKAKQNNSWPVGTNILTAEQARKMLEDILVSTPAEESGWLIECDSINPCWLIADGGVAYDANCALRFARKKDAEAFIKIIRDATFGGLILKLFSKPNGNAEWKATEHIFM